MGKIDYREIAYQAEKFRTDYVLNNSEPINCKALLWKLNILTVYKPLSSNFSGMCLKKNDTRFILINSNNPRGRQHYTIAHELYHLYLQTAFTPHICNPDALRTDDINEKKANIFAAHFLMPENGLRNTIPEGELKSKSLSISTILKLEQIYSVSHSAMLNRLLFLGFLTKEQYDVFNSLKIQQVALEYGFGLDLYKKGNEGVIIGDYGVRAKDLFSQSKISESHYYELMNAIGFDPTTETNE